MGQFGRLIAVLGFILLIGGLLQFLVWLYEHLTTKDMRKKHRLLLLSKLRALRKMRSLALAQQDAGRLLRILNKIYDTKPRAGKKYSDEFLFKSRSAWLWRPLIISLIIACLYIIPFVTYSTVTISRYIYQMFGGPRPNFISVLWLIIRYSIIFIPTNAILDLLSVNITRKLLFLMTKSSSLLHLVVLAVLDLLLAVLLYLTGPIWTVIEYLLGPNFFRMLRSRLIYGFLNLIQSSILASIHFLLHPLETLHAIFRGEPTLITAFFIMYSTTIIPTIIHLLITIVFFGSKIFAQPMRCAIEKWLGYMVRLTKGVSLLFAIFGVAFLVVAFWLLLSIF